MRPQFTSSSRISVYVALACLLVAPSLLMALKLASSLAVGTVLASVVILLIGMLQPFPLQRLRRSAPWIAVVLLAIVFHLFIAAQFNGVDFARAAGSLPLLAVMVLGAAALLDLLASMPPECLRILANRSAVLLLGLGAWGCIGLFQPFSGGNYEKPIFPFTEPSHFGLFMAPVLIAACAMGTPIQRSIYISTMLVEAMVVQNLTMVCAALLAAMICLRPAHLTLLLLIAIPVITSLDLTYYVDRLDFSSENQNLSTLVLVQGWQMLADSWSASKGLGLGFQQLGVNGSSADATLLIQALMGDDLNLLDGGFNFSKLISEFGALGLLLAAFYSFALFKSIATLRRSVIRKQPVAPIDLMIASIIIGYILELMVRGAGYFTPTGLLMSSAIVSRSLVSISDKK